MKSVKICFAILFLILVSLFSHRLSTLMVKKIFPLQIWLKGKRIVCRYGN
jgi:hypothetical protein